MTVDQLVKELLSDEPTRRLTAADDLSRRGPEALPATAALVQACSDPALRDLCVGALEELGPPPTDQLPQLAELAKVKQLDVAYWAATLLGRAGSAAAAYAGVLEDLAGDASTPEAVRNRAAWALRKVRSN
ncbi:hypothetical protein Pla108_28550 [Botrimarina colliarenosi]|uniref:HEAT repeat protein n=1 Tax=Botrimarina colliarenosi TaxID=2528001 RepID=A0A5C6ACN0_9BACT|nr:HEAT repeat domain-containing protein [Botrimarina colliarenosi]TWT97078.1 hypothetical protein Pla108_28550 [Botrimarina colliarenosi]